jgi:DNA-binding protein H-NS
MHQQPFRRSLRYQRWETAIGLTDRLRQLSRKAAGTAAEHKDQLDHALRMAATAAGKRTSGRYHDQIIKAETQAEGYVENLQAPAGQPTQATKATDETPGHSAG